MAKKIYVGNLVWGVTSDDLLALFGTYGEVGEAQVISDKETGRSRGFGFVQMQSDEEAQRAIDALNGTDFQGRALTVNEARPREDHRGGGSRGGYGGGGPAGGSGRGGYGGRSGYSGRGRDY
jgi:RNA recognition motif-containing protein